LLGREVVSLHGYIIRQVIRDTDHPEGDRFTLVGESQMTGEKAYLFTASHPLTVVGVIAALRADGMSTGEVDRLFAQARDAFRG
jgi:hypothetical protein